MSEYFIPPYTPLLYSKNGVYRGIHYFLIFALKHMSADLTKGSFGHFSSFYVIRISKTSKISIFFMFLQKSQIAFNM